MRLTDTKKDLSGGGSSFFKIAEGQPVNIRFLYNTIDDIKNDGLVAHSIMPQESGLQYNVNVLCALKSDDDPLTNCKWCASGHKQVGRYPLALYNVDTGAIQYWLKSAQYVDGLMDTLSEIVPAGKPISGQVLKMIRTGKGTQTQYNLVPQGTNDGTMPDRFGEVLQPEDRNLIKPADWTPAEVTNGGVGFQQQGGNYGNGYNPNMYGNMQGTRRTTDVF